jgi:hypothetical protein
MASLDFANMSKQDLVVFRRKAIKAGERPSAKNNYFTVTLSAVANKQPDDWVPTALFKTWCEHHGPSNHATAECHNADGMRRKPASQLKAEENARRLKKYMEHVSPLLFRG